MRNGFVVIKSATEQRMILLCLAGEDKFRINQILKLADDRNGILL
jgi:hypothetical protein